MQICNAKTVVQMCNANLRCKICNVKSVMQICTTDLQCITVLTAFALQILTDFALQICTSDQICITDLHYRTSLFFVLQIMICIANLVRYLRYRFASQAFVTDLQCIALQILETKNVEANQNLQCKSVMQICNANL